MSDETRVRLHARLNNDIVPIAYCRHAQARILVREGQAVWTDGHLVLTDAIAIRHKDQHPVLAECYKTLDHRAKTAVRSLARAEQALPIVEAVLGDKCSPEARLNGYGDTILSFTGQPNAEGVYASGWIEVWAHEAFSVYLNRHEKHTAEFEQECIDVHEGKVRRLGRTGLASTDPDEPPRDSLTYVPNEDLLDTLAFELQAVAAVLQDPTAPLLIEQSIPEGVTVLAPG